jgi:hypothetical protein
MRLQVVVTAFAAVAAVGLLALPADAAPKKKTIVYDARGHTVFTSRNEEGKTRTRIIIQKRSFLDPGTEVLPGEQNDHDYAFLPNQRASSVLDNTPFGGTQSALPDSFTLDSRNGPWLRF